MGMMVISKAKLLLYRCIHFLLRHVASADGIIEQKVASMSKTECELNTEILLAPLNSKDKFFTDISIITHAGGGLQGMSYLNCKEAFSFYYNQGNRVFEYDVDISSDGKYIATHTENPVTEKEHLDLLVDGRFSPVSIKECLDKLIAYSDIKVVFDCKFRNLKDFAQFIVDNCNSKEALERIVIQVFEETNIHEIREVYDFKMLYVCMYNADYVKIANCCIKNKVGAVSVPVKAIDERIGWEVFDKSNICAFAYSVNILSEYNKLSEKKFTGVFSDFLYDRDVC